MWYVLDVALEVAKAFNNLSISLSLSLFLFLSLSLSLDVALKVTKGVDNFNSSRPHRKLLRPALARQLRAKIAK
jgi:hypothetical protein